nr:DUF1707 domain-containing protein [Kribbella sandramycini]
MEHGDLSRIELARRLGVRGPKVQKLLDKLVSETFVARYPQDDLPTEYGLTEAGVGRLKLVRQFQQAPWSTLGQVTAAALTQRRRQPVIRREKDRLRLRLSDAERSACSAALAEQFSIGRLDTEELKRRSDRLYAATTRAELAVVFDGLPMPQLDEPTAPAPAGVPWRWVGFGIAVACSLPFLLIGYGLLTNPRDLDNILFGLFCAGGVLVWNYFAWTWARRGSRV